MGQLNVIASKFKEASSVRTLCIHEVNLVLDHEQGGCCSNGKLISDGGGCWRRLSTLNVCFF